MTGAKEICLGIDSSSPVISAAILSDGAVVAEAAAEGGPSGEVLLQLINSVFQQAHIRAADVRRVAVGIGPGSFTGIRNGVSTAQGFAFPSRLPVYGVSSLLALSEPRPRSFQVVLIPANAQENFAAVFSKAAESNSALTVESGAFSLPKSVQSGAEISLWKEQGSWQRPQIDDRAEWEMDVIQPYLGENGARIQPTLATRMAQLTYGDIQPHTQSFSKDIDCCQLFQLSIAGRELCPVYAKPVNAKTLEERGIKVPEVFKAT